MITSYNQFVNESSDLSRATEVTVEEAAHLIKTSCQKFDPRTSPLLFRGRSNASSTGCSVSDPSQFVRKSLSKSEHYNFLLNNLPAWSAYPKRNKSTMYANVESIVYTFGDPHFFFPLEDKPIAVCAKPDIFSSFTVLDEAFDMSISDLNDGMRLYNVRLTSWADMSDDLDATWERVWDGEGNDHLYSTKSLNKLVRMDRDWRVVFAKVLDPTANGFGLGHYDGHTMGTLDGRHIIPAQGQITLANYAPQAPPRGINGQEMWTEAKCLTVDTAYAEELLSALSA